MDRRGPRHRRRGGRRHRRRRRVDGDVVRMVGGRRDARAPSRHTSTRPAAPAPARGCGSGTGHPRGRCRGRVPGTTAIPSCRGCSTGTGRTSCCAGTSTRRRSSPVARGRPGTATPGCSTAGTSSVPCRATCDWTSPAARRRGGRSPAAASSARRRWSVSSVSIGRRSDPPSISTGGRDASRPRIASTISRWPAGIGVLRADIAEVGRQAVEATGELPGQLQRQLRGATAKNVSGSPTTRTVDGSTATTVAVRGDRRAAHRPRRRRIRAA